MENLILTSIERFVDLHIIDDEARFWLELDEIPELNPIREYKNIVIEVPYESTVSYDLETRTASLIKLFDSKRSNKKYLIKMLIRLQDKCEQEGRSDLVRLLDQELQKRAGKL